MRIGFGGVAKRRGSLGTGAKNTEAMQMERKVRKGRAVGKWWGKIGWGGGGNGVYVSDGRGCEGGNVL